jgi:hypothetical protein
MMSLTSGPVNGAMRILVASYGRRIEYGSPLAPGLADLEAPRGHHP